MVGGIQETGFVAKWILPYALIKQAPPPSSVANNRHRLWPNVVKVFFVVKPVHNKTPSPSVHQRARELGDSLRLVVVVHVVGYGSWSSCVPVPTPRDRNATRMSLAGNRWTAERKSVC